MEKDPLRGGAGNAIPLSVSPSYQAVGDQQVSHACIFALNHPYGSS